MTKTRNELFYIINNNLLEFLPFYTTIQTIPKHSGLEYKKKLCSPCNIFIPNNCLVQAWWTRLSDTNGKMLVLCLKSEVVVFNL